MTSLLLPIFALFIRAIREEQQSKFSPVVRTFGLLATLIVLWGFKEFDGIALLTVVGTVNFIGITLLGIATFSGVITEEKEDGNLALLRMTRLNPLAILLGKSSARFTTGLLFLAAQLPFTLLSVTLGGVTLGQVLRVYAVLAAYLFFLCNLGLLSSVLSRTTARALVITVLVWVFLYVLAPFVWYANPTPESLWEKISGYLTGIHPFADVYPFTRSGFQQNSLVFSLGAGLVCFALAWLGFERCCGGEATEASPARRKTLARRRAQGSRRAWRWPLVWKDFTISNGGWRGIQLRLAIYAAALGTIAWVGWKDFGKLALQELAFTWQSIGCIGFFLEATLAAATVFASERSRQTLGTLCATPIPVSRLAWEKVLGHLLPLLPAACLWGFGASLSGDTLSPESRYTVATPGLPALGERQIFAFSQALAFALFAGAVAARWWKAALTFVLLLFFIIPYNPTPDGIPPLADEVMPVYFCAFIAFYLVLIAYLSLRLRRGAVITTLFIVLGWSLFTGGTLWRLLTRGYFRWDTPDSPGQLWFLSTVLIIAGAILVVKIPDLLAKAAAEE